MTSIRFCPDCYVRRNQYHNPDCQIMALTKNQVWYGRPEEIPSVYWRKTDITDESNGLTDLDT